MTRASKKPAKTADKPRAAGPARTQAPAEGSSLATTDPHPDASATPKLPTGTRRAWLLATFAFLVSAGLPWSCRNSPVGFTFQWASIPSPGDRLLALHAVVPLLMLVAVASRETAPRKWARMSVASLSFFGMASLAIVAFGELLPSRPQLSSISFYQDIPRAIRSYDGWSRYALRALLFAPTALVSGWALAAKGTDRAPVANRLLLGFVCAGLTLAWRPLCTNWGHWVAVAASAAVLLIAPLVPDEPPALDPPQRKRVVLASALWFAALAALAFTRTRRL